ncbi:AT-hook motif nuclear-localized protein [Melia azedarach]|uniref:AT-hook motif nuclear-localized protein n=1 Tax=Melia azedarach TaxID=155640 RepID=A0ACC1XSW7_MELAZ|nr:AT-hook motif nuclear-localized protein [Melia azedarach]
MSDREETEKMNMVNMRLAFNADGAAVYKPVMPTGPPPPPPTAETYQPDISLFQQHEQEHHQHHQAANSVSLSGGAGEPAKRKRGRPRKYAPDGSNGNSLGVNLASPPPSAMAASSSNSYKKARGRPLGSSRKQLSAAFGSSGAGFMPHVITVQAGEDVLAKIMSFSQNGPRAVCILSANGAISNVTLRQAMTSGGTVTYEGRFEILSLSGSILLSENGGQRSRTGGLSVSLAGPDGRVLGGGVAGLLIAASPVQVIVGSFLAEGWKETKSVIQTEPLSSISMPRFLPGPSAVGSPASRGNLSESSGGPGSPLNQNTGGCSNSNPPSIPNIWK